MPNLPVGPCSGGCNDAIGGQGQSGCIRPVCRRSLSELRISVCTMLKDAATLSWLDLVKQVLPSKDSCWLASANGAVASSSPCEGRTALPTIVLPRIYSSRGAARGSPCSGVSSADRSRRSSQAAHCSSSNKRRSSYKRGQPAAAADKGPHTVHCK